MNDFAKEIKQDGKVYKYHDFPNIHSFVEYIENTKNNQIFAKTFSSHSGSWGFTETKNYGEALELLKHGWSEGIEKLNKGLSLKVESGTTIKSQYNVVGGNASVARYLQGVPTNMIEQKRVKKQTRVITLNKSVAYNCQITTDKIIAESKKALQIAHLIESKGYRVNLNLIWGTTCGNEDFVCKIRLKNASERLNVSKLGFAMCHPSMLRRFMFKLLETTTLIENPGFKNGYGYPFDNDATGKQKYNKYMGKDEYMLPAFINDVEQFAKGFGC